MSCRVAKDMGIRAHAAFLEKNGNIPELQIFGE